MVDNGTRCVIAAFVAVRTCSPCVIPPSMARQVDPEEVLSGSARGWEFGGRMVRVDITRECSAASNWSVLGHSLLKAVAGTDVRARRPRRRGSYGAIRYV